MRRDLIVTFKIITGLVNYGHNMFGTNTAYRTRNLNVTSHHPLRSAHDFFNKQLSNIGTSGHYACEIQQVSTPLRLVLTSLSHLNLIRLMGSGNYRKRFAPRAAILHECQNYLGGGGGLGGSEKIRENFSRPSPRRAIIPDARPLGKKNQDGRH